MRYLLAILLLSNSYFLFAQTESLFDYLDAHADSLQFHLETDYRKLIRSKREKEFQPCLLRIVAGERTMEFPGKVRARGHIRLEVCSLPSLKIKLKKKGLRLEGFTDSLNKLKLIQQCSDGDVGLGYLQRERLAYQLWDSLGDHGHRTIPLHLRPRQKPERGKYVAPDVRALLIEEEKQLEARYGGRVLRTARASAGTLDSIAYAKLCLFNYLILNTDWAIYNLHNVEILALRNSRPIPIPYDFDYSGFVSTTYSLPNEQLDIKTVQEPHFLGRKVTPAALQIAAADFITRETAVRHLILTTDLLGKRDRKRILRRLDAFYEILHDEQDLLRLLRNG